MAATTEAAPARPEQRMPWVGVTDVPSSIVVVVAPVRASRGAARRWRA